VSGSVSGASVPLTQRDERHIDVGRRQLQVHRQAGEGQHVQRAIVDTADNCTVAGGAGTIDMSDITVAVSCVVQSAQSADRHSYGEPERSAGKSFVRPAPPESAGSYSHRLR
jgi:hypothetical protein